MHDETAEDTKRLLLEIPPEVLLHIFSFLDLPELSSVARAHPELTMLTEDPVLHHTRVYVVAPARVSHQLFGQSEAGLPLRPTVGDLVHRGIMRGLGIEWKWRMGTYFYSQHMVKQYEMSLRLQRTHAADVVSSSLRRRSNATLSRVYYARVLPNEALAWPADISTSLIPTMRRLNWSIQRDKLARCVKERIGVAPAGDAVAWLDGRGKPVMRREHERVRLALCPGIKGIVRFYESLNRA